MAFAVKIQACTGVPGHDPLTNPDYRGGEPADTHQTLKLPGMGHGIEIDPIDDSELQVWIDRAKAFNAAVVPMTAELPEHIEMRIMDSDGHP